MARAHTNATLCGIITIEHAAMTTEEMIKGCIKGKRKAQKHLYEVYGPVLLGVVRRYIRDMHDAEDVFVEAMFKILTKIDTYRDEGSFEGWMKRIAANEALMHLRKSRNFNMVREIDHNIEDDTPDIESRLLADELLELLDQLPTGYRTIFNMYVVEGYKHREIAEELGISINTSKSQLILAKRRMRELLKKNDRKAC